MPGYEGMLAVREGPGGLCHPPVLSDQYPQPETEPSYSNWDFPTPSKEDARRALIKYVSEQSYDSTKPAEQCVITNMEAFDIYKYSLETYMEKRTTVWSRVPYIGQKIDMSEQTPPLPWEIPANAPTLFQNVEQAIQVPHTTSVQVRVPSHSDHSEHSEGKTLHNLFSTI
uniref:protein SSUH2 homolog n=1 Tax=Monopterus albus TaxID=43700 RepID=UPI0009B4A375